MSFEQTTSQIEVVEQPPKPKKFKIKKKKKINSVSNIEIEYNSETYNLENSNDTKLVVKKTYTDYQTEPLSEKKPIIKLTYNNIYIKSNNIHHIYVILQYIYDKKTLIE